MINMYKNDTVHACAKKQWGPQCSPGLVQFYSQECLALPHNLFQISLKYRYFILYFRCKSAVRLNSNLSTGHPEKSGTQHGRPCPSIAGLVVEWCSSGCCGSSCLWHCSVTTLRAPQPLIAPCFWLSPRQGVHYLGRVIRSVLNFRLGNLYTLVFTASRNLLCVLRMSFLTRRMETGAVLCLLFPFSVCYIVCSSSLVKLTSPSSWFDEKRPLFWRPLLPTVIPKGCSYKSGHSSGDLPC